jgi:uncharacterized damage-inducible protein DinB
MARPGDAVNTARDLERLHREMRANRERLLATVGRLTADELRIERPGGWSIGRVLEHVIDAEFTYAKLLAHQCGKTAPDCDTSPPMVGAGADGGLAATRSAVLLIF